MRQLADNELGFQQVALCRPAQTKTYLFVNAERMVVGCLVAESIRQVRGRGRSDPPGPPRGSLVVLTRSTSCLAGLQSSGAGGPPQRHDEGRLHGAPQGVVLLHRPRAGPVWSQPDLGVQPGQASGHREPHAGHRQVLSSSIPRADVSVQVKHTKLEGFFCCFFQEHLHIRQSSDKGGDRLL